MDGDVDASGFDMSMFVDNTEGFAGDAYDGDASSSSFYIEFPGIIGDGDSWTYDGDWPGVITPQSGLMHY